MSEPATKEPNSVSSLPIAPIVVGRYLLHAPIARGGMATIHIARLMGDEGFSRVVAAKRLHPHFTEDADFVAMFRHEAHVASRIHHPNVVPVLDVVLADQELVLVQEYCHGVPLDKLIYEAFRNESTPVPIGIVVAIMSGVLSGLGAAHDATDERGEPLNIVHRDVSPQNVQVSAEGVARLLDFGIAKARSSSNVTRDGFFKGKIAYMPPEQLRGENVSSAADIYATGVLLWELLAHRRLHAGRGEAELFATVLSGALPTLTAAVEANGAHVDRERWAEIQRLEPVVTRALSTRPELRYRRAQDMQEAMLVAAPPATAMEVAQWVRTAGAEYLARCQAVINAAEETWMELSRPSGKFSVDSGGHPSVRPGEAGHRSSIRPIALNRWGDRSESRLGVVIPPMSRSMSSLTPLSALMPPPPLQEVVVTIPSPAAKLTQHPAFLLVVFGLSVVVAFSLLFSLSGPAKSPLSVPASAASAARPVDVTATTPQAERIEFPAESPAAVASSTAAATATAAASAAAAAERAAAAPRFVVRAPPVRRGAPPPPPSPPSAHPAKADKPADKADKPEPAAAPPPPAPAPAPAAKADCDPPFYFEGPKKIFKSHCL